MVETGWVVDQGVPLDRSQVVWPPYPQIGIPSSLSGLWDVHHRTFAQYELCCNGMADSKRLDNLVCAKSSACWSIRSNSPTSIQTIHTEAGFDDGARQKIKGDYSQRSEGWEESDKEQPAMGRG